MFPSEFSLRAATKRFDDRIVFDSIELTITPGERVGVIGDNGAGKSTLLDLLAGTLPLDNGERRVVAPGGIAHLGQHLPLSDQASVQDAIDHTLADLRVLEARMRELENRMSAAGATELDALLDEYADAVAAFESRDGYNADAQVDAGLHALGLPDLDRARPLGSLSGGERSRLALAATLASNAELLLLDEPTNDLDDVAVRWLEDRLDRHRGTIVAVTHDRTFLERLTRVILVVDEGGLRRYGGGYTAYLAAKEAERRARLVAYEQWRADLARNAQLVDANAARMDASPRKQEKAGFGHGAFRARGREHGAMSRIRMAKAQLERLCERPVAPPADPLVFAPPLPASDPSPRPSILPESKAPSASDAADGDEPIIELSGIRVGDRLHVDQLQLTPGERMLVTGANGAGKSTLLNVIAGSLEPDEGRVSAPVRVGMLRQNVRRWTRGTTLLSAFAQARSAYADGALAYELLALGLFRPDDLGRDMCELSYGQQRRFELALLVTRPADLLLLDEPTNHLAPALVEELEKALTTFAGTVIVVTHDRRMRSRFRGRRLRLEQGRILEP